ncbi:hypothetical protein bas21_0023 [Escherichia phage GottfriedDienst]|nr:hypothetical protein bas21_0023 [Escherichia phage GottfriedDienst]
MQHLHLLTLQLKKLHRLVKVLPQRVSTHRQQLKKLI